MEDKYKHRIMTIPNVLSMFRLLLVPMIVWLYVYKQDYLWTAVILVISGITDVVDGFIARKFNMISDFGKAFDPVADKLTQMATLLCLITRFPELLVPLILLVVKEIFAAVTGLLIIRKTGVVLGAVWHGKAATVCLYSMIIIHILWFNIPSAVSWTLVGICTATVLVSAIGYGIRNLSILLNGEKSDERV